MRRRWENSEYRATWAPIVIMSLISVPVVLGYLWLIVSTLSDRTHGLIPVDSAGNFGGFTMRNWSFLWEDPSIWRITLNTFLLAVGLTVGVVAVSSMAGYALSRLKFPGRRPLLAGMLILHAFPSVTLLISIFFVLRWLRDVPIIGSDIPLIGGLGYNTVGGVILVSVALQLPLGIWLMKGFFDGVSWDMERAALIDGCSRFQGWWKVVLPAVRPGIAALAVFAFIVGWGSFIIPYTYLVDPTNNVIAVYLNDLLGATSPVNYGSVAAIGLFQLVPVLVFFFFTQEYLLNIFAGGAKGGA
ncbi:MAG: ABC transporter permease subunit [Acidimicrobiia bacterium]|nr:ABC transporter permease subunit [Acidimicrobiia bacterium]